MAWTVRDPPGVGYSNCVHPPYDNPLSPDWHLPRPARSGPVFTCIHDGEDPSTLERLSHGGMPVDLPAGTAHGGRSGTAGAPDAGFPSLPASASSQPWGRVELPPSLAGDPSAYLRSGSHAGRQALRRKTSREPPVQVHGWKEADLAASSLPEPESSPKDPDPNPLHNVALLVCLGARSRNLRVR